jgi:hypothetical protein
VPQKDCGNNRLANIDFVVTINQPPASAKPSKSGTKAKAKASTNDFHWTPEDGDLLRQFIAKCALEFGGRKAGRVLDALAKKWVEGRVKVRL